MVIRIARGKWNQHLHEFFNLACNGGMLERVLDQAIPRREHRSDRIGNGVQLELRDRGWSKTVSGRKGMAEELIDIADWGCSSFLRQPDERIDPLVNHSLGVRLVRYRVPGNEAG